MLEQKLQRKNHQQVVMARPKSTAFLYVFTREASYNTAASSADDSGATSG